MAKRTTVTLEDDVVGRLEDAARRTGRPLKAVVNDAIRAGLDPRGSRKRTRFQVQSQPMGVRPGIELDDIGGLLERIEGPEHR
jgi:predicted transcriptional regulator